MVPGSILSIQIHSDRYQYELCEVWFNKIDHIHTYGAAKVNIFSWVFYGRIFSGFSSSMALFFFKWPQDQFWVFKSLQICPNMMSTKFCPKKLVEGVHWACQTSKNVYANKIPNFTFYFLVILSVMHLPKWMHMGCKKQGHFSHTWVEDPCKVWGHQSGVM